MKKRANLLIFFCLVGLISVGVLLQTKDKPATQKPKPSAPKTPWSLITGGLNDDHLICSHSGYDSELEHYLELPLDSAERYFLRGLGYSNREQWEKAEENFRQALLREPEDVPSLFHLAEVEFETKRYQEAAQTLTKIIEIEPRYFQAYGELSLCQRVLGLEDESRKNWNRYRQVIPQTEYEFNHLAKMLHRRGEYKESWSTANEGLKIAPTFSPLLANRARAMMALGHSEASRADLSLAISGRSYGVSYYRDRIKVSGDDEALIQADLETIDQLQAEVLP